MKFVVPVLWLVMLSLFPVAGLAATGKELLELGRVDEAISALQTQSNDADAQNLLCRAYYDVQNWERAIAACEKATTLAPGNSWYHLWLGRAYGQKAAQSHFVTAAALARKVKLEFERSVQLDLHNAEAISDLAEFYLQAPVLMGGGTEKALAQTQTLQQVNPALGTRMKARIAERDKRYAEAETEFRAAALAGNSGDSWYDLAEFYQRRGRMDDMEKAIQHVPGTSTSRPATLVQSAELLLNTGRNFNAAVAMLRQYLAQSSPEESPKAHYLLGALLEKQGDKKSAAEEYRNTLARARSFPSAQIALDRTSH